MKITIDKIMEALMGNMQTTMTKNIKEEIIRQISHENKKIKNNIIELAINDFLYN
jgi:hypothetical protein